MRWAKEYHGRVEGMGAMDMGLDRAAPADGDAAYGRFHPYYAELCALTQIRKRPGFGVPLQSGIGGHCLLYLNGVQRDRDAAYPTLKLRAPDRAPLAHAVCISVNSHYKNANWVAAEGRDFIWRGALEPGERLTRDGYERTQRHAKATGMLDGVVFQDALFRDKPAGMSRQDFMYELSVATDYAARFGRDIYRARIPLDQARMSAIVDYLNDLNEPYRNGALVFKWRVLNNNCVHVVHNALAAAGVWAPWPTGQFFARAAFKFPVPKNAFVDLMLRTNDLPIEDADAMYADEAARRALLANGALPTAPGALAFADKAVPGDDIYDTRKLRLIFYDNPFWGPYRFRLARIFKEPRYVGLQANLCHFEAVYAACANRRPGNGTSRHRRDRAEFQERYDAHIADQTARVNRQLSQLAPVAARLAEAAS